MSILNKIKSLFEEVAPATFKDVKAADGTLLRIEDLKEGAKASVIAEDGSVSDAPANDYTLEDGTVITIDDKATISKITAPVSQSKYSKETLDFAEKIGKKEEELKDYPWDECIMDAMKEYGDKEIAKKVCGKIKAENQAAIEMAVETPAQDTTSAPVETPETPEEETAEDNKVVELEQKVAELEAAIQIIAEQLKTILDGDNSAQAEMADIKKENKILKKQNKELAAEPAAPAVAFKKVEIADKNAKTNMKETPAMLNRILALKEKNNK